MIYTRLFSRAASAVAKGYMKMDEKGCLHDVFMVGAALDEEGIDGRRQRMPLPNEQRRRLDENRIVIGACIDLFCVQVRGICQKRFCVCYTTRWF